MRFRWRTGATVYHRVFGVGVVRHVQNGPGPKSPWYHSPNVEATVSFPGHPAFTRPLRAFDPVITLARLVELAKVTPTVAPELAADPRFTPDVPADASRGIHEPYYRYEHIPRAKAIYGAPVPPRLKLRKDWIAPRTAAWLRKQVEASDHTPAFLAREAEVPESCVRNLLSGHRTRRDNARKLVETLQRLDAEGVPATRIPRVGQAGVRALQRALAQVDALGWTRTVIAAQCGVSDTFLRNLETLKEGPTRDTAIQILRGLRELHAAAAPLPPLGFAPRDVELLRSRLARVRAPFDFILPPVLAEGLRQLLEAARRADVQQDEVARAAERPREQIYRTREALTDPPISVARSLLRGLDRLLIAQRVLESPALAPSSLALRTLDAFVPAWGYVNAVPPHRPPRLTMPPRRTDDAFVSRPDPALTLWWLRKRIERSHYSSGDLARETGMTRKAILNIRNGGNTPPRTQDAIIAAIERLDARNAPRTQRIGERARLAVWRRIDAAVKAGLDYRTIGTLAGVHGSRVYMIHKDHEGMTRETALGFLRGLARHRRETAA